MTSERIKEIQETTAYPESVSVQQALLKVWNECAQEFNLTNAKLVDENERLSTLLDEKINESVHYDGEMISLKEELEQAKSLAPEVWWRMDEQVKMIKQLKSELSAAKERVNELEKNRNTNLELLIDVADYLTSAEDKYMSQNELENYIQTLGYKLELALKNYRDKLY